MIWLKWIAKLNKFNSKKTNYISDCNRRNFIEMKNICFSFISLIMIYIYFQNIFFAKSGRQAPVAMIEQAGPPSRRAKRLKRTDTSPGNMFLK